MHYKIIPARFENLQGVALEFSEYEKPDGESKRIVPFYECLRERRIFFKSEREAFLWLAERATPAASPAPTEETKVQKLRTCILEALTQLTCHAKNPMKSVQDVLERGLE